MMNKVEITKYEQRLDETVQESVSEFMISRSDDSMTSK